MANYHTRRLGITRKLMEERGIDVLLATSPNSVPYFTGLALADPFHVLGGSKDTIVLPREGEPILITRLDRALHSAKHEKWWVRDIRGYVMGAGPHFPDVPPMKLIGDTLRELQMDKGSIGIEEECVTLPHYRALREQLPDAKFVDVSRMLQEQIAVKDEKGLELIRKAAECLDIGLNATIDALEEGKTEHQLAAECDYAMIKAGAFPWFPTVIGAGVGEKGRSWIFAASATDNVVHKGDPVTIDPAPMYLGAYKSSCSDFALGDGACTAILGQPDPEYKKMCENVTGIAYKTIDAMVPGAVTGDLDKLLREELDKYRYGKYFPVKLGHGLGYFYLPPSLGYGNRTVLKENMFVDLNFGVFIPNKWGFKLEMMTLVRKKKGEVLTKYPLDLIIKA